MKFGYFLPVAAGLVLFANMSIAKADDSPSVLVKITPLVRGSLPQVVTVYGSVGTASSARQTLMAPIQAEVADVYVRNGSLVPAGAPLLKLVPSPASQSAYMQADSALNLATQLVGRTKSLVAGHLATDEQLFQAENNEANARATLTMLKAQGAEGPTTLSAPFQAIVTTVSITPGAIVAQGDGLVELARPNQLQLQVGVIPDKALLIKEGDPVSLTPIGGGSVISGKVVFRGSLVSAADGLVPVAVSLPAGQALLGETFQAEITIGKVKGYLVPHNAILVDDTGQTYIVQDHAMTAKLVDVKVLGSSQSQDIVSGPLEAGAPVVLSGNYQLNDGDAIRFSNSSKGASQ